MLTPGYNGLGQAYSLSGSQSYVNGAFYNYLGKPSEIQLANGLSQRTNYFGIDTPTTFGTSQFGRMRQICVAAPGAGNCYDDQRTDGTTATTLNLTYWFDNLGNLTAMGDRSAGYTTGGTGNTAHTYAYDDLNRLVSGSASGGEFPNFASAWTFDALGNMTGNGGVTQGYSASGPNSLRPHAVITTSNALNGNYNYDLNGNMTTRLDAGVTYTHTWDAQNRLGSVTAPGKDTAWVYDADGARAIKVSGPITTVYVGGSVEVQISGTLRLTTTYYFFGGARIVMRVGATVTFLHGDRLGSASLATDAAGSVLSQERYYVWGSASMMSGTMPTDFQWQNQRRLDETQAGKLYDFNARFFTPVTGRFISPDSIVPNPADPQSLNRYTAMANNPLKFTDPTGQREACEDYCSHGAGYTGGGSRHNGALGGRASGGLRISFTIVGRVSFSTTDKATIVRAAIAIGVRVASAHNRDARLALRLGESTSYQPKTSEDAFNEVLGGITFERVDYTCAPWTCWGRAVDANTVRIFVDAAVTDPKFIVHEVGHVFDVRTGNSGRETLAAARSADKSFPTRISEPHGFFGELYGWQQSPDADETEEFADMFIGWVYNQWGTNERGGLNSAGAKRATMMNANAPRWIELAVDFTKKAGISPNK